MSGIMMNAVCCNYRGKPDNYGGRITNRYNAQMLKRLGFTDQMGDVIQTSYRR